MASRRMIDPAFWQSENIAKLTREQRLTFVGLFSNADDQGRLKAHPAFIRSRLYPYDDIEIDTIQDELNQIAQTKAILIYTAEDEKEYIQITGWWKYQSPTWAWPSKIPAPAGWKDRERYRVGNQPVENNWTDPETNDGLEWPHSDPIVGPQWDDSETTPRNSNSGSNSSSGNLDVGASPLPENPSSKPDTKQPKIKSPPAVLAFRRACHRYPAKSWYQNIDNVVGKNETDLQFWESVVKNYVGMGWNPGNVKGMLEFYKRREIPGTNNGRPRAPTRNQVPDDMPDYQFDENGLY